MKPPAGVSEEEWARARELAAECAIGELSKRGGFYPEKVREAFRQGLCDTSGDVARFVRGPDGKAPQDRENEDFWRDALLRRPFDESDI